MATTINSNTTDGIIITPDTSGEIHLQANGVTKAKVTANGLQDANGASLRGGMYRNLIINGDMKIDQRNAGTSVTPTGDIYTLDRWKAWMTNASKFSVQQNAGSVTPPTGFKNYLGITSLAATTPAAGDYYGLQQFIEGFNAAHLGFGTASAKTVTISFWVRSSLTGTFSGNLNNSAFNRSYPFTYTISSANTWEQKTITISGDTTGTWLTTNGIGLGVWFSLGVGSNYTGTANTWSGANYLSATGATSVVGTSGATWQLTGVQVEVGEGASDFEFLPYDVQLLRCLRYYNYMTGNNIHGYHYGGSNSIADVWFTVPMRATPTATYTSGSAGSTFNVQDNKKGYIFQSNQGDTYIHTLKLSAEL